MILPNRIKTLFKIYSVHIFQISHQKDFSLLPYKSRYKKFLLVNSFQQEYIFFIKDSGIFFIVKYHKYGLPTCPPSHQSLSQIIYNYG